MKEVSFYKNLFEKYIVKKNLDLQDNKDLSSTNIQQAINYILSQNSKRIRPVLMLMFCKLYSDVLEECMPAALSIELLHNFTLVHDDIMDDSKLRRSQETIYAKWGNNTAILTGDFLFNEALSTLQDVNDDKKFKNILKIINKSLFELCIGQDQDLYFENSENVSMSNYFQMIYNKTASLIKSSILIGSYIGGASVIEMDKIKDIGISLGYIFQLKDDYLDLYGEPSFGKKRYNDIINNKKTFFYVKAQEIASKKDKDKLKLLYSCRSIDVVKKIDQVISIYNDLNIKSFLNKKLEIEYQIIQQKMLDLDIEKNSVKDIILDYIKFLISRNV
tara:strand:- start:1686 stop:2681 length:996 start_codon:yes stop_codon:yes gene_type:complete